MLSIKLLCNFIEIALWHGCSPINLLHIFRRPFPKNTSGGLLLVLLPRLGILDSTTSADKKTYSIESGGTLAKLGVLLKSCFVVWDIEVF